VAGLEERVVGAVLGLALGDALGAPFEFRRRDAIPSPLPAFDLPWMGLPPGSTTDDTAMARNLVRSLGERGGFDPDDLVRRHVEWLATGPPDVGNLTGKVLGRIRAGTSWEDAARQVWEERGPDVSAGNGSVMYCAPLGVAYAGRSGDLLDLAPRLSALTHWDERCRTCVLAVSLAVAALVRGETPSDAVGEALGSLVLGREGGEELEYLVGNAGEIRRIDGPDMGLCLFTAGVGLQALARLASGEAGPIEDEMVRVVAFGGDTDTNAAVAGALLGAAVGMEGLPRAWLDRLVDRDAVEEEARALLPLARTVG
jgi:ADP-ribosyl-[dinitrogen reductase] hydrolase